MRSLLLGYPWGIFNQKEGEGSWETPKKTTSCSSVKISGIDKPEKEGFFYESPYWQGYGLLALKDEYKITQIYWGQLDIDNACITNDPSQKIVQVSPEAKVGIDANLNNILVSESKIGSSINTTSFYSVTWPIETHPNSGSQLQTILRLFSNKNLNIENQGWPVFLPTKPHDFAQDVLVGNQQIRFFDSVPKKLQSQPKTDNELLSSHEDYCEQFLGSIFLERTVTSKLKYFGFGSSHPDAPDYCLRVSEKTQGGFFGDLFRVDPAGPIALVSNLSFGEKLPDTVELVGENLEFTSGDNRFKQPWSWQAWSKLAKGVKLEEFEKLENFTPSDNEIDQFKPINTLFPGVCENDQTLKNLSLKICQTQHSREQH